MKRILITGANSYIGTSFEKYIKHSFSDDYKVDAVNMIDGSWRKRNFEGYDAILHVAGIAHQRETKENAHMYYEINRDLAIEVASKAKAHNVKQFIFLSSMNVYGKDTGVITRDTNLKPKTNYGKSKLQAEEGIIKLRDSNFRVCILRPPMVYGEGCKGNYQAIVKLVKKYPVFPRINNKRSLVHIDNLAVFIKEAIDGQYDGLFFPQDLKYVRTIDLAKDIANNLNKKIYFSIILGAVVVLMYPFSRKIRKAFGSLIYKTNE